MTNEYLQTIDKTIINNDVPPELRQKPRKASRGLEVSFSTENKKLLAECEIIIDKALSNFVHVGNAIKKINDKKLYKITHKSFSLYCEERLGLKRRTAYQKIDVAEVFENVRNCAHIDPVNENQVKQLLPLKTIELQQKAWKNTVANMDENKVAPTANDVKKAVDLIRSANGTRDRAEMFKSDNTFNTITLRWELMLSLQTNKESNCLFKTIINRIKINSDVNNPNPDTSVNKTVLINANSEILFSSVSNNDIQWLLKACESVPNFNFLLWTSHPDILQQWQSNGIIENWPKNVSLAFRISTADDAELLKLQWVKKFPLDTIWVTPETPFMLTTLPCNIRRILIGDRSWFENQQEETIIALRQTIGNIICKNNNKIIIDIEKGTQKIFYQL